METAIIPHPDRTGGPFPQLVSGIDRITGFSSDFLNQFNEVVMLLDCVATGDVHSVEDLLEWQPRGYTAHFAAGGLPNRSRIVSAYRKAPGGSRQRLDTLAAELSAVVTAGGAFVGACRRAGALDSIAPLARHLASDVRRRLAALDSLVHAGASRPSNAEVSLLFARRAA